MNVKRSFLNLLVLRRTEATTTGGKQTETGTCSNYCSISSSEVLDSAVRENEKVLTSLSIVTSVHAVGSNRASFTEDTNRDAIF
jgi:hypothetical protein